VAAVSRCASARHVVPDPLSNPSGFTAAVSSIVRETAADYVLPITEASILALRGETASPPVMSPSLQAFERIRDKELVLRVAADLGVAVPHQVVVHCAADAPDLVPLRFPLVVKPARSVAGGPSARVKSSVFYAAD